MIPTPVEFWTLNNTRVGAVSGLVAQSADEIERYVDGVIDQGWCAINPGDVLVVDPPTGINTGGSWTLSCWLNITWVNGMVQHHAAVYDGETAKLRVRTRVLIGAKKIEIAIAGTTKTFAVTSSNGWRHLVVRYDAATTSLTVTLDNVSPASQTVADPGAAAAPIFYFGGYKINYSVSPIDAVGWWSVRLTDEDVAECYNAGAGWEYTPPPDDTPDAFAFAHVTAADPSTVYVSDSQVITGMDAGTAISITGGEYRLDGGAWTAAAGTIDPWQTLELRATSSAESEGVVTVTITVGTVSVDWTLTTKLIASVVTTILWGSTPDTSRILSSRIVRGAL